MTPEGVRIESICRAAWNASGDDYWEDVDPFTQMLLITKRWLKERGEPVEAAWPTEAQMRRCAFDTMGDAWPAAGSA